MINCVFIEGNLVYDPVLRTTAKGDKILSFPLANEVGVKNPDGSWGKHVNYIDVVMFGNRAEALSQLLKQGTRVVVKGVLNYSSWEKDGVKKSKHELRADDLSFLTRKETEECELSPNEIEF